MSLLLADLDAATPALGAAALQRAILSSANFSSIATDALGVIQVFNTGAERMLGYSAAEVMNKLTPADMSDPDELVLRASELSSAFETQIRPGFEALVFKAARGIEDIYELTYIRKDGTRLPAMVSVTALRGAADSVIGYLLIGTDNSARKAAEREQDKLDQRLRDQQFYTRSLIESSIDALMTTDPRGIITDANKQAETLTGATRDELIGSPFKKYFTDPARAEAAIRLVLAEKKVSNYELIARSADRGTTPVSFNAATFYDRERTLQGVFAAARDVSEQKRAEDSLRRAKLVAETANEELEAFSYSVSHDLRAPLRSIDGFSLALSEDSAEHLDADGRENLDRIRAGVQRMGKLIDDLLQLAGVTRSEMRHERVDLSALFNEVVADLRAADPDRTVDVAIEDGMTAEGDARLLRIAVVNLVGNAWKFTGTSDDPRIECGRATSHGTTSYFVRDNGVGFDMAYVDKLFGAFQRLHAATEFSGTGIGLATVRRIVARHGGRTWATGAVGAGATLSFTLAE